MKFINYPKSRDNDKFLKLIYKCDILIIASIVKNVTFNHNALGVVIHPNSVIGNNVHIELHVCLG